MVVIGGETDCDTAAQDIKEPDSSKQEEELPAKRKAASSSDESESKNMAIGDVWVFDTVQTRWFEIKPQLKI